MIAPLCRDEIIRGASRIERTGGAGLYMARALAKLGARVTLHTPLGDDDRDLIEALPPGIDVTIHPARRATRFRLTLDAQDPDLRTLECTTIGGPFDPGRIEAGDADLVLLGPLLPTDLMKDLREKLHRIAAPIDLGVQGMARIVESDGTIRLARRADLGDLPPIRILAGDDEEVARVRGIRAKEIVITRGSRGAVVQLDEAAPEIVIPPARLDAPPQEAIGLGDTFLAVYAWWRSSGLEAADAGARAAEAAGRVLVGED